MLVGDLPLITVIIVVRNREEQLLRCLRSLNEQRAAPPFDVVVVDDGSSIPVEQTVAQQSWGFPLMLVRQIPLGIASARNAGAEKATGDVMVYLDSDCVAAPDMLSNLIGSLHHNAEHAAYQLWLVGGDGCAADRIEDLRLTATLEELRTRDGLIAYANTSAFALRRNAVPGPRPFDPTLLRGEDTGLLADLLRSGQTPVLVTGAVVAHQPGTPLHRYIAKHFSIGYRCGPARALLAQTGAHASARTTRLGILRRILHRSVSSPNGSRAPVALTLFCYALERVGRVGYSLFGMRPRRFPLLTAVVDVIRQRALLDRLLWSGEHGDGLVVTYVNARTLAYARMNPRFSSTLRACDLVYADGMGAVLALLATRARRTHKVTADDIFLDFCREGAARGLRVAFVGSTTPTIAKLEAVLDELAPSLHVVYARDGYFGKSSEEAVLDELHRARPDAVVLAMGQPTQEAFALKLRERFERCTIWCVGGLFDVLTDPTYAPPRWVRSCGFEWLYRLWRHPRYVWRRYLVGLPFLGALIAEDLVRRAGTGFSALTRSPKARLRRRGHRGEG